jgi:GntR family transcriptional regulator
MWLDGVAADAVSGANGTPLHSQLASLLRASVADGSLPPGSHLPTEAELQDKFGVSRSVVRQSLAALSAEGLIQRGRGRGSVVAPLHEHHRQVQRMPGLSAQISTTAGPVSTEVLSLGPGTDARAEAALGTADLLSLRRRRSAEGEAIALIQTWLPMSLAGTLTVQELTDASLHATLASKFGVPVTAGRRQIRAVAASARLAEELALPVGSPLLLLEGASLDDRGNPVEYFSTWHRADRVVFDLEVGGLTAPSNAALATRVNELARELASLSAQLQS